MPQILLHLTYVDVIHQQVGGKRMPKRMHRRILKPPAPLEGTETRRELRVTEPVS